MVRVKAKNIMPFEKNRSYSENKFPATFGSNDYYSL